MVTENRSRSVKIEDPQAYFANWVFSIEPHHYETLGLGFREFIKDKKPSWSWAVMEPPQYCFEIGYVFYDAQNSAHFLQVAADWDALHLEVHEGLKGVERGRFAFAVTELGLSVWLRTGVRPTGLVQLDIPSSKAGLLAWEIASQIDGCEVVAEHTHEGQTS